MVSLEEVKKLMDCFPGSFLNGRLEIIVSVKGNVFFTVGDCETELDMKCKVLEWFSRDASCSMPFTSKKRNDAYHDAILYGINSYLGTLFSIDEMENIYAKLGNCCNHPLTVKFIESGYDMDVLK